MIIFLSFHLFLRSMPEIFDISFLSVSLWLFGHHTFQYRSLSIFPTQILVCAMTFAALSLFSRFDICWAIKKKHKKCGKIYRHKSIQLSRPSRLLTNHSWQAWRSIYNSHTDFKISPTQIYVHIEQARLVTALRH